MVFLFHSRHVMLGFVPKYEDFLFRRSILVSKLLKRDIPQENFNLLSKILWSSCRLCSQICHFCVTCVEGFFTNCDTGFQLFGVNREGCHMWGRKFSLFPEHLISLPLGSSWFYPFIIYTLHNKSVQGLMTGLFAWISLTALSIFLFSILPYYIRVNAKIMEWNT